MSTSDKQQVMESWRTGIVATKGLGMGINQHDVRVVVRIGFRAALHGQLTLALCVMCRSKAIWNRNSTCVITLFASCEMALSMHGRGGGRYPNNGLKRRTASQLRIDGEND